ncbi:MAG TPA: alpha/beta hydrolase family protein [Polyangiaceae bacterium LLY-WYZ-15_(1-7)]|nr:alpha/beta hydrolase family protein [Polyangiaceae bacterium LLY-WYZ-15_(1-7)]HJL02050.1 alpha/beta hydrolase family protein [Polyangiaceae bacterium LLY-WYZ-15_(1-7)]HJL13920.1 alpha/beta hydrolase family protein [Polyangiaceae bacterium LLY-WYZ-15_(1-7)]HJL30283.1 alpha/beta hydrolase family protein [Polyangiaceae bacterium LLY-WYZ-15_(1-7)]HJL34691.1 alpha/beta hydrolase family protein [Polyangiaceae bacterium LLY-WYZ-15_(1-7)]
MTTVLSRIRHGGAEEPPRPRTGPWWETLPADFAYQPEPFALQGMDKVRVGATAATDVVIRTAGASLVGALALPLGFHPLELKRAMDDLAFYAAMAESGDPTRFFRSPPPDVRVRAEKADWYPRFSPDDGHCEVLRFDSPFMPVNPRLHRRYLRHAENRIAHARYWHHDDGPRPTIVAIHGFSADLYLVNEWFFALPWFYRMGCDVLLYTLPFHGERQPKYSPFSGHGYFAGGPSHINEAVAQSVMDFRILVDWLMKKRGVPKIGVTGVSLGGFTSSVLAVAEPRLSFAIPNVPVVTLPDLVLEWQPIGVAVKAALRLVKKRIVDARHLLAVSNPLTYAPAIEREGLFIVGGVGDRLAPPKHSRLLWEHWGRCRMHWFPGSHLLHLDRGVYLEEVAKFLHQLDFLPRS